MATAICTSCVVPQIRALHLNLWTHSAPPQGQPINCSYLLHFMMAEANCHHPSTSPLCSCRGLDCFDGRRRVGEQVGSPRLRPVQRCWLSAQVRFLPALQSIPPSRPCAGAITSASRAGIDVIADFVGHRLACVAASRAGQGNLASGAAGGSPAPIQRR